MANYTFLVQEKYGISRTSQPISICIPFKKGELNTNQSLKCSLAEEDSSQEDFACYYTPISLWTDGTVKWAKVELLVSVLPSQTLYYNVSIHNENLDAQMLFEQNILPEHSELSHTNVSIVGKENQEFKFTLDELLGSEGGVRIEEGIHLNLVTELDNAGVLKCSLSILNSNKAEHINGQWDLGDANSFFFKSLGFNFVNLTSGKCKNIETQESFELSEGFTLIQHSSGGDNWQSTNHLDFQNKIPFNIKGYEINTNQNNILGERFTPVLTFNNAESMSLYVDKFWQNFPSSIKTNDVGTTVSFFPDLEYLHELQPGEQKTFNFFLDFSNKQRALEVGILSPLKVTLNPEEITKTRALPMFTSEVEPKLNDIIMQGIVGSSNFFAKREIADEYGWRNFGDLYADHENTEYKGEGDVVSHYNNQYDPIYGFLKQYLISGEEKWWQLADDLAQHVIDIDIYKTNRDKPEYNNGLFWHTDHYADAATASHRTYSKNQPKGIYMDHAGGGGPGGQHCYTTGLMLHYLLTGSDKSKQTVLNLAAWITNVYEGSNTLFDFALGYKNRHRKDLKNVVTGKYPLDRGTGNYLIALLDAFELTSKQSYLDQAGLIVKNTVYLEDKLEDFDLLNVEESWFYTVFLQAVCRFIYTKKVNNQTDEAEYYANCVLQKFAVWMAEKEQPYLNNPDILEFPNDTWTAQDIRKANVLYFAAKYCSLDKEQEHQFITKADEIYEYVVTKLADSEESQFTRVLCILMQNQGVRDFFQGIPSSLFSQQNGVKHTPQKSSGLVKKLLIKISELNVNEELDWLRKRLDKVERWLNNKETIND